MKLKRANQQNPNARINQPNRESPSNVQQPAALEMVPMPSENDEAIYSLHLQILPDIGANVPMMCRRT